MRELPLLRRQENQENVPFVPPLSPSNLLAGKEYTRLQLATILQSALDIVEGDDYDDAVFGEGF
jgi:hypothetical protein